MSEPFVPNTDQLSGLEFMMLHSFGALFWDPGTRKTSTFLYGYKLLRDAGFVRRMLVLSEVNVVNDVWPEEIEKWSGLDVTYATTQGMTQRRRLAQFDLDADVYLVNNENVEWLHNDVFKRGGLGVDMLVVDESGNYRTRKTNRFRALRKMLRAFKRRYIGTGTPTPKDYLNLWTQMYIVDRGESLGPTLTGYKNEYFEPTGFKGKVWELRDGADVEIQRAISHRVHRVEKDMDVTISFEDRWVDLPGRAAKAYKELEEEFITQWRGKTLLAANAAVATTKLRQAANGAIYYDPELLEVRPRRGERRWLEIHREKLEALRRLIKELRGEPLLVAYEFQHDYEMMAKHGLRFPSYSLASAGRERTALKEAWNRGELAVLSSQIASVSHGLNLQRGGHNLAYYGLTFDLEKFLQFYQRLWRDGQRHDVRAFRLATRGTVDEVMMDVLQVRDRNQRMLLDALKRRYDV